MGLGFDLLGANKLHAIAAIRCAKKFVWYELAYFYFPAGYSNTQALEFRSESSYSSDCGAIYMFR